MTRVENRKNQAPFFSICVPQYGRTSFFLETLRSIAAQDFGDFEVCVSDDRSTDGRGGEIVDFLRASGLSFVYAVRETNGRYDANLRSAISLSMGRYCFLMGNDDCLASASSLGVVRRAMKEGAGVVIANYEDYATGKAYRRVVAGDLGSGPAAAAAHFRDFSFVSGVVLDGARARALATDRWDGSEMYQTYLGCRILAEGRALSGVEQAIVRMGIRIEGESVDSYAAKARLKPCPLVERALPLNDLPRLAYDAIEPSLAAAQKASYIRRIFGQIYAFTYPFWIFEYRRVQSWKYAAGVCLGMRPARTMRGIKAGFFTRNFLRALYGAVTLAGLVIPGRIFFAAYGVLYKMAKRSA